MKEYKCEECEEPTTPILFENQLAYARLSNPSFAPGHIVVLPKDHAKSLADLTKEERKDMDELTLMAQKSLEEEFGYKNIIIWENEGPNRSVEHYHRHVIPGDKIEGEWPIKIGNIKTLKNEEITELTYKLIST